MNTRYTFVDPTRRLPDEVGIFVSEIGVQLLQVRKTADTAESHVVVLESWKWSRIYRYKAIAGVGNSDEMDLFRM